MYYFSFSAFCVIVLNMAKLTEAGLMARRLNAKAPNSGKRGIEDTTMYRKAFTAYIVARVMADKEALIDAMINEAKAGNVTAFTALIDRTHGKPIQGVALSDSEGSPLVFMPLELIDKHDLKVIEVENKANIERPQ